MAKKNKKNTNIVGFSGNLAFVYEFLEEGAPAKKLERTQNTPSYKQGKTFRVPKTKMSDFFY